jgi:aryl-alcohol dehydrogenase-like predicted oxidoreductase
MVQRTIMQEFAFPKVALGTMNFGKRTPEKESREILDLAFERGVRLWDTANAYVQGESERIVGRAAKGRRESVQIATKVGFGQNVGKPEGLSGARITAAIDESLLRLGTDYVDLYYLHVPDHGTPLEESLEAMAGLLEKKKIRAWGVSNFASWQVLQMMHIADARKMPRPVISQQLYNLVIRQLDVEYWKFTRRFPIHTTVYNPLAGGLLTGKHQKDGSTFGGSRFDKNKLYQARYTHEAMFARVSELTEIARAAGLSLLELSYAWLAQKPEVGSILVGPGTKDHLTDALLAMEKSVPGATLAELDLAWFRWMGTETTYAR